MPLIPGKSPFTQERKIRGVLETIGHRVRHLVKGRLRVGDPIFDSPSCWGESFYTVINSADVLWETTGFWPFRTHRVLVELADHGNTACIRVLEIREVAMEMLERFSKEVGHSIKVLEEYKAGATWSSGPY